MDVQRMMCLCVFGIQITFRRSHHNAPRYPVDKGALAEYLRHQTQSNLLRLSARSKQKSSWPDASSGGGEDEKSGVISQEWLMRQAKSKSDKQGKMGPALEEYLSHQKDRKKWEREVENKGQGVDEGTGNDGVGMLAAAILGTAQTHASQRGDEAHLSESNSPDMKGQAHKSDENVIKVIGKLQKEIDLDTQAITAFRSEMVKVLQSKKDGRKAATEKLNVGNKKNTDDILS